MSKMKSSLWGVVMLTLSVLTMPQGPQGRPVVADQNGSREQGHEPTGHGLPAQRAVDQARDLTSDDDHQRGEGERAEHFREFSGNTVITTGELVATGGGKQYLAIMGFLPETIRVHVGETVEWTNFDPI